MKGEQRGEGRKGETYLWALAERRSRGRNQPQIDGGQSSRGWRRRSAGGGFNRQQRLETRGAAADLQASIGGQDDGLSTGRLGLQSQMGGRPADGWSRGRRPWSCRRMGGAESVAHGLAGRWAEQRPWTRGAAESADGRSRHAPSDSRSPPCSLPLPPLLSFLLSLSFPALQRCGGPRAGV